jgi:hypothetical protein
VNPDSSTYISFNKSPSDCIDNLQKDYTKYNALTERHETPNDLKIENKLQEQHVGNLGHVAQPVTCMLENRDPSEP